MSWQLHFKVKRDAKKELEGVSVRREPFDCKNDLHFNSMTFRLLHLGWLIFQLLKKYIGLKIQKDVKNTFEKIASSAHENVKNR